jgi:hypothetical protein
MGDVFNAGYPFIDAGNGGGIEGMIAFCKGVHAELNTDTEVVPGHGPVKTYRNFTAYIAMLETVSERISSMIDDGLSLQQVVDARPSAEFDDSFGDPALLVNRAYLSLAR